MTERRGFFAAVAALTCGLFTPRGRAAPRPGTIPFVKRDAAGNCQARAYRMAPDGSYQEVGLLEPKPGDRIIVIGLDGFRLWSADAFTVGPAGSSVGPTGDPEADMLHGSSRDLFDWPGRPIQRGRVPTGAELAGSVIQGQTA